MKDIILKLIDQLPSILVAMASFLAAVFAYRNGQKSDAIKVQAAVNMEKTDAIKTQGEEIHTLVNGNVKKMRADLADALERVSKLETAAKKEIS